MNTVIHTFRLRFCTLFLLTLSLYFATTPAQAVPSFARQTSLPCQSCHTVYPELTPFGRSFKMHGYTMTNVTQVEADNTDLKINQLPPISAMLQISVTNTKADTPSTNVDFPDQLSLFYAGEISPKMGSFIQITMEGSTGSFALDNTDIRYADQAGAVTYGATLNNNPTVQDVWNSTQAWGYPFTHGAEITTPVINDLGGVVAGLGGYADWGKGVYTELTFYSDTGGFDAVDSGLPSSTMTNARINGVAPYWRLAWENTFGSGDRLMLGTYGMQTTLYDLDSTNPDAPAISGPHDKYTDIAVDTQYEHTMGNGKDIISAHATYTNEDQALDYSSPGDNPTLKSTRVDGIYHWDHMATATLAYNRSTGGIDNSYDDTAWTAQLSYLPWQNTKFTLQYVAYTKLAGSTDAVSDNNTALLQSWLMW